LGAVLRYASSGQLEGRTDAGGEAVSRSKYHRKIGELLDALAALAALG
jgi:hypothetical protein